MGTGVNTTLLADTLRLVNMSRQICLKDQGFSSFILILYFYYEQLRELKEILICGCWWNERPKVKTEGSTCLTYTGLCGELGHP